MKVLVCASEYYPFIPVGGIGVCVHNVVKYLRKMGIECDVCSPYGPDIKIPLRFIDMNFGVLSLLLYWHRLSKHFEQYKNYDVIWLHQPLILREVPFENCIVTMHSSIFDYNKIVQKTNFPPLLKIYYNIREKIEKQCIQRINRHALYFSAVSQYVANSLESIGIPHKKIVYIPNGVNVHRFKPASSSNKERLRKFYDIPKNDIVFTYVGRITWVKQPFTLIRFFSKLSRQLKNVWLLVVGNGELFNDVKRFAFKLGLKKILFLGFVKNEELPSIYACSDFYLMTSIYEAAPITVLEAMASGLPPIVSNIPTLRYIVKESNSGLVLDFKNIEESVKKTLQFIKEENIEEHSKRARRFIENNHSWEKVASQYMQLLNRIISRL